MEEISSLIKLIETANASLYWAKEEEDYCNDATQDVFHLIEFAPKKMDIEKTNELITELRQRRRLAKETRERCECLLKWSTNNSKAFELLKATLGELRKIDSKQETRQYRWKTSIFDEKGNILRIDEKEDTKKELDIENLIKVL